MMAVRRAFGRLTRVAAGAVLLQTGPCDLDDPASREFIVDQLIVPQALRFFSDTIFFFLDKTLAGLLS